MTTDEAQTTEQPASDRPQRRRLVWLGFPGLGGLGGGLGRGGGSPIPMGKGGGLVLMLGDL